MAWKIYKKGQGYWTRMVSGIAGGVLVVGGALWLWEMFDNRYVQASVALVVVGVFGLLLFHTVAVRRNTSDFLIATEGEMKKVNWPSRREVLGSTWVVLVCTALLVTVLALSDLGFSSLFTWLNILQR